MYKAPGLSFNGALMWGPDVITGLYNQEQYYLQKNCHRSYEVIQKLGEEFAKRTYTYDTNWFQYER